VSEGVEAIDVSLQFDDFSAGSLLSPFKSSQDILVVRIVLVAGCLRCFLDP